MEMLALLLPSDGSAWTITVQPVGVYALGSTAVACVGLKYLIDWYKRSQHRDAAAKLGHHAKTLREQVCATLQHRPGNTAPAFSAATGRLGLAFSRIIISQACHKKSILLLKAA